MATSKRGESRGGNRGRAGQNNNSGGRNQYGGVTGAARANPLAAAAAVGSAVATGVFLWSRRSRLSEQIESLSNQVKEWRGSTESDFVGENVSGDNSFATGSPRARGSRGRSQAQIAEEALTLKETGASA
jgi:hypothetical protein